MDHHCEHCETGHVKIGRKLKIFGFVFIALFAASFLPGLEPLNAAFIDYSIIIWWAVLLGLLFGGLIDHFVPDDFIFKYLGQKRKRSLLFAVFAGFLMSACSHGILALAIQLYKKGANIPSVITFLMASPWANFPITILLFSFFGVKAFAFVLAAMVIALITGLAFMVLDNFGLIEKAKKVSFNPKYEWTNVKNFDFKKAVKGTWAGAVSLANMVLWWLIIGFLAAVFIRAYVPAHYFMQYFGPTIGGLLLTLVFATILEVCSEGSSLIAFEIFNKVGTLGNPFVFLMAGVATDYTEIGLLWTNIGKRTAIWLPVISVPLILVTGWLFNLYL